MSGFDGLDEEFARRLRALIEASGGRIHIGSGYRSVEEQQALWDASAQDGVWVAAPGKSNHNWGVAADLGFDGDAEAWAHENAPRYGLVFPMSWEPWHIEPIGVREGTYQSDAPDLPTEGNPGTPESYTVAPAGEKSPVDATNRFDLKYQLMVVNDILLGRSSGKATNVITGPSGGSRTLPEQEVGAKPTEVRGV